MKPFKKVEVEDKSVEEYEPNSRPLGLFLLSDEYQANCVQGETLRRAKSEARMGDNDKNLASCITSQHQAASRVSVG